MKRIKPLLPYGVFTIVIVCVFIYTVSIRQPWFGQLISGDQHNLTGSTLKFARIWYQEKPWNVAFGMIEQPRSVENGSLQQREPYISYPPGAVIPIYLLAVLLGHEPTVAMVMGFNLFSHVVTALLLTYLAFFLFKRALKNALFSYVLPLIPGLLFLLLPGVLFWQQNIYFADQAVILPVVIIMLIEIVRDQRQSQRLTTILNIAQPIVMVYGSLTDYFFLFLLIVLYLKRLLTDKQIKSVKSLITTTLRFWWPALLTYAAFILQVIYLGGLAHLQEKLLQRTGMQMAESNIRLRFFEIFWLQHIFNAYGKQAFWLIWISLFNVLAWAVTYWVGLRKTMEPAKRNQFLRLFFYGAAFVVPQFLQIYWLREHSYMHDFSSFKFSLTVTMVPFVFIPIQLSSLSQKQNSNRSSSSAVRLYLAGLIMVVLVFILYLFRHVNHEDLQLLLNSLLIAWPVFITVFLLSADFPVSPSLAIIAVGVTVLILIYIAFPLYRNHFGKTSLNYEALGNSIRKCTNYNEVLISPVYNAPSNPPQMITFTMKPVHKIDQFAQIKQYTDQIKKPYDLVGIFPEKPQGQYDDWLKYKLTQWSCGGNYFVLLDKRILQ
ncbi:hypothetical protein M1523_02155 [Patescibacteria group bacterium]|nr:hypothetical protein [Patescibacteria group bacterium]MCL5091472.1 hypothetical protein [Patescibacteria group bacterium]